MNEKPLTEAQKRDVEDMLARLRDGKPAVNTSRMYDSIPRKPGLLVDRSGQAYFRDDRGTLRRIPHLDPINVAIRKAKELDVKDPKD